VLLHENGANVKPNDKILQSWYKGNTSRSNNLISQPLSLKKQEAESISRYVSSRLFPASSDNINTGWHTAFMNILPSKSRTPKLKIKIS